MLRTSRIPVIIIALFVLCHTAPAAGQDFIWNAGFGGVYEESLGAVAVDPAGNTICVGKFYDTIDLGGGPQVGAGGRDFFIVKFGLDGAYHWSHVFGGLQNDSIYDVVALSDGSLVVSGLFRGTLDLGGVPLTATGTTDAFVACFSSTGSHDWCLAIGGSGSQSADQLAIDSLGNILVAGSFFTEVDFGSGPLASQGTSDVFVAKYTSTGSHLWGAGYGRAMGESEISIAAAQHDAVVVAGDFTLTIDFGGGNLTALGDGSFYIAKLASADGSHIWSQSYGGVNGATVAAIAVDAQGAIACVGEFVGPLNLGGDTFNSTGFFPDTYIAKLDTGGVHVWSRAVSSQGVEPPTDLDIDAFDNIHLIGYHALGGTLDFGGGALPDAGNGDVYVAGYETDGTHLWSASYGDASQQTGETLAVGPTNGIVIGGTFMGSPDFGGGALSNNGDADIFVVSLTSPGYESPVPDIPPATTARLWQNVPNPFNPITTIGYHVSTAASVSLTVFDLSGRRVRTLLANTQLNPGNYTANWNGRDEAGRAVAGGVYLYRLKVGANTQTRRMVLAK